MFSSSCARLANIGYTDYNSQCQKRHDWQRKKSSRQRKNIQLESLAQHAQDFCNKKRKFSKPRASFTITRVFRSQQLQRYTVSFDTKTNVFNQSMFVPIFLKRFRYGNVLILWTRLSTCRLKQYFDEETYVSFDRK